MISISGLGSSTALRLIHATRAGQMDVLRSEPINARSEQAFRERISQIDSPEAFVADFEVYSFVMRAFDLEDQIFGKGLMRKVLEADPVEPSSLLNRLTDPRFRELHLALGFTTEDGPQTPDFSRVSFQDAIVDRFYNRQFINDNDVQNSTVGTVLEFRDRADDIQSWFDVLSNEKMTDFFKIALGLPNQISGLDLDRQAKLLEDRFDLADLSDPEVRKNLITRYTAISDVVNPQGVSPGNVAVSILQSANFGAQFVPITLDVATINFSAVQLYR